MKFSLTRLFIKRPTLVFVIIALMTFAGILSTVTIVKELYPDVSQPTVTISVQYNGASVTEMRDNIVAPIEQNLAGTADLQTINSVVQQGQARITAIFDISSDSATDLALTNKAIQAAEKYLPTNLTPPTVNLTIRRNPRSSPSRSTRRSFRFRVSRSTRPTSSRRSSSKSPASRSSTWAAWSRRRTRSSSIRHVWRRQT